MFLKLAKGSRYLGRFIFIWYWSMHATWLRDKVLVWEGGAQKLAGVVHHHPQVDYTGMNKHLQHEWYFVQHITQGFRIYFQMMEDSLRSYLLLFLFHWVEQHIPERDFNRLPVNQEGMELTYPTMYAPGNWNESCIITDHLVEALQGWTYFRYGDNAIPFNEIRLDI